MRSFNEQRQLLKDAGLGTLGLSNCRIPQTEGPEQEGME